MNWQPIEKHKPREYSAFTHDGGVVLCDKTNGAFLVLRFTEDLERLKAILETVMIVRTSTDEQRDPLPGADLQYGCHFPQRDGYTERACRDEGLRCDVCPHWQPVKEG